MLAEVESQILVLQRRLNEMGNTYSASELNRNFTLYENRSMYSILRENSQLLSSLSDMEATQRFLRSLIDRRRSFRPESFSELPIVLIVPESHTEVDSGAMTREHLTQQQNLGDITGDIMEEKVFDDSWDIPTGQVGLTPIDEFLDRPVEIASGTIAVGANLSAQYPLWDLVSKEPSIRAKMRNFAFMRANIGFRIIVSGSPFHYGRILASYQPHAGKNRNLLAHASNIAVDPTYRDILLNYLSQSENSCVIDVRANKPVEMVAPFISPKPMLRLYNNGSAVLSAATSLEDFVDMGDLFIYTFEPISSVSTGTPTSLSYSIYAWFEDVDLGVPTASHLEISTESKDERETGPLEKISSTAADISGALSTVPYLAPFALPSKLIFSGLSKIASIFGWARPPIIREPMIVKNRPFMSTSNCIGSETTHRICYDPKQEICVDGLCVATARDNLVFQEITSKYSFFDRITWASSDTVRTPLKRYIVHPQMNTYYTDAGATPMELVQPSSLSWVATTMEYWRGDITYLLDFSTSQYHRGKWAVWFEPNHFHESLISLDMMLNKNFIQIVDLAVTNTLEFTVQWASHFPWLKTFSPGEVKGAHEFGAILTNLNEYVNGYIVMAPYTTLQSPDTSSIEIHVYVKSDNIRFQQMTDDIPNGRALITPESHSEKNPISEDSQGVILNPSTASMTNISLYHFGEQPVSFRSLLKRYTTVGAIQDTSVAAVSHFVVQSDIYPQPYPLYNSTGGFPNLLGYLRYGFLGIKGGYRYRAHMRGADFVYSPGSRTVVNLDRPVTAYVPLTMNEANVALYTKMIGAEEYLPHTNGGVEFEIPFYSQNLFVFSFADDLFGSYNYGELSNRFTRSFTVSQEIAGGIGTTVYCHLVGASGEDFNLLRFSGAPYYTY